MPVATKSKRRKRAAASRPRGEDRLEKVAGISTAAVEKATGRGWADWVRILDRDGAAKLGHPEIARLVSAKHGVGDWWSQMVTVGYEQARGLRARHQRPDGFTISGNKTVNVPVARLYRAWADAKLRERWLPDADLEVRRVTANKSMRITWDASKADGPTSVDANFYAKGEGKSQVSLNHTKLPSAAAGDRMKRFWRGRLDSLKKVLEA
ncbi:MAG: SRPBCC domain-containing protein [Phycisphaerales bacterium]